MVVSREQINLTYSDFNDVIVYAFRYALGRKTYAVQDMSSILIKHKDNISHNSKFVICRDIKRAINNKEIGMSFDQKSWIDVLECFNKDL